MRTLSESDWRRERATYRARVEPWVERRRTQRSRGLKHPVEDFIWEYYGLRSGRLLAWSPGAGVVLENGSGEEFPDREGYGTVTGGRVLDLDVWLEKRGDGCRWILNLLRRTRERPPMFGCLGLHEWAMVYEADDIRHAQVPLRLPHAEVRRVVESLPMRCSHFDAYRFFSAGARPLNRTPLTAEGRPEQEQPGCLHANMDLFKWCMKLQPLVPSSLTGRCFELACETRFIDMRAAPYDLTEYGLEPIAIETAEGRSAYTQAQRHVAEAAAPLRQELIVVLEEALNP